MSNTESTFYDTFLDQLNKQEEHPHIELRPTITDIQESSIRDATFFDRIPKEDFLIVAKMLIEHLNTYNRSQARKLVSELGLEDAVEEDTEEARKLMHPVTEADKKKIEDAIKATKNFIKVVDDKNLSTFYGCDEAYRDNLTERAQIFLDVLEQGGARISKKLIRSKTPLINFIKQVCKKYDIPTREGKNFIDSLDNHHNTE